MDGANNVTIILPECDHKGKLTTLHSLCLHYQAKEFQF